mgnify:CR=1 FL=1
MDTLKPGLTYTSSLDVTEDKLALHVGSGDLPVFATPAMMALMENAAMMAVSAHLPEGCTTVGSEISSTHLRPNVLGGKVSATAYIENFNVTRGVSSSLYFTGYFRGGKREVGEKRVHQG